MKKCEFIYNRRLYIIREPNGMFWWKMFMTELEAMEMENNGYIVKRK